MITGEKIFLEGIKTFGFREKKWHSGQEKFKRDTLYTFTVKDGQKRLIRLSKWDIFQRLLKKIRKKALNDEVLAKIVAKNYKDYVYYNREEIKETLEKMPIAPPANISKNKTFNDNRQIRQVFVSNGKKKSIENNSPKKLISKG